MEEERWQTEEVRVEGGILEVVVVLMCVQVEEEGTNTHLYM
jgi:hypothetical protein